MRTARPPSCAGAPAPARNRHEIRHVDATRFIDGPPSGRGQGRGRTPTVRALRDCPGELPWTLRKRCRGASFPPGTEGRMRVLFIYPSLDCPPGINHGITALSGVLKEHGHE